MNSEQDKKRKWWFMLTDDDLEIEIDHDLTEEDLRRIWTFLEDSLVGHQGRDIAINCDDDSG